MSESMRLLAERKRLLLARSRLHRLEIEYHAGELRGAFKQPRAALSMAASPALRPVILAGLMAVMGRGRLGRILKVAMALVAVANAAGTIRRATRGNAEEDAG